MALSADQCIKVKLLTKPILPEPPMNRACPTTTTTPSFPIPLLRCWLFTDLFTIKREDFLTIFLPDDFELNTFISKKIHWFQSFGIYQIGLLRHHFACVNKDSTCIWQECVLCCLGLRLYIWPLDRVCSSHCPHHLCSHGIFTTCTELSKISYSSCIFLYLLLFPFLS